MRALRFAVLASTLLFSIGCGSTPSSETPSAAVDASAPASDAAVEIIPDAHAHDAADAAPATLPTPMPKVDPRGGDIFRHPKVVTITFPGDPFRETLETFDDYVTTSSWWTAVTHEYCGAPGSTDCIGGGSSGGHVVMPAPANATYALADMDNLIRDNVTNGTFPAPTPETIYAVFFPENVTIGDPGYMSCSEFEAYHYFTDVVPPLTPNDGADGGATDAGADPADATLDGGVPEASAPSVFVAYAIMARCKPSAALLTLDVAHEIVEATTDPFNNGYWIDDDAWSAFFYGEVGDLCINEQPITVDGYTVQRTWSNASAAAGHNPCVPVPQGDVYYSASPEKRAKPISLKVGQSITIDVHAFSERDIGEWSLQAADYDELYQRPPALSLSLDRKTVSNGSVARLTIKLLRAPDPTPSNPDGVALYALVSSRSNEYHYFPGLVVPKL